MSVPQFNGSRRDILVICPGCEFRSTVPPAAIARNSYFCSRCGKSIDLLSQEYRPSYNNGEGEFVRRDKPPARQRGNRNGRR